LLECFKKKWLKEYALLHVQKYTEFSVFLISAFYKRTYLFNVSENVFSPQPKVQSAVIRLERNFKDDPKCNISLFFKIVKTAFGQRRKILNNSLSVYNLPKEHPLLRKRAEQLSVNDFVELTHFVSEYQDEIKS